MTQPKPAAPCPSRYASTSGSTAGAVVACRQNGQHTVHSNLAAAAADRVTWVGGDDNELILPCDWCRRPGATHTDGEHPLPRNHPDYDAFFDATDDELSAMASEAIKNFGAA